MRARDIMSSPAVTVSRTASISEAATMLAGNGFSALPVVDEEGLLVGIVTEADLTVRRMPTEPKVQVSPENVLPLPRPGRSVAEVMTSRVIAIPATTDVAELATTMLNLHLRSVPIVDGRRVVGMVTRRDLVRIMAQDESSVARDVRNRLETYGGRGRWTVSVTNGVASIGDAYDDATDRHVAAVLAEAVPGVTRAEVVPRES
jgi:CBS domain-containing protein